MSLTLALGVDPESRALAFVANALGLAGTPALRVVAASDPALPAVDLGREGSALAAKPENAAKVRHKRPRCLKALLQSHGVGGRAALPCAPAGPFRRASTLLNACFIVISWAALLMLRAVCRTRQYTGAVVHTLQDSSGASYSAFGTIVLGLVGASNDAAAAGGANPAEQARVTSWLSFAELHAKDASALEAVDMYLVDRSFLATSGVSVADLVIFHVLYAAVASMAEKKKRQLSNLTRWFDQIQHEACVLAGEHAPALLTFPRAAVAFPSASKDAKAKASGAAAPKKAKAKAAAAGGAGGAGGAAGKPSVKGADSEAAKKAAAKKAEKEAKKAKRKAQKGAAGPTKPAGIGVHMCQFLVGEVTMAQNHPDPDKTKLLHEEINCGETEIRTLVSGLVGHYEPADLVVSLPKL